MDGYQPPLLSLQDMLNLDEEEGDSWSENPYSISNFFEPIVTATGPAGGGSVGGAAGFSGASASSAAYSRDPFEDVDFGDNANFSNCQQQQDSGSDGNRISRGGIDVKGEVISEDAIYTRSGFVGYEDDEAQDEIDEDFPDLEMFEESVVVEELKDDQDSQQPPVLEMVEDVEPESILPHFEEENESLNSVSPRKTWKRTTVPTANTQKDRTAQPHSATPGLPDKQPTLKEVNLKDLRTEALKEKEKLIMKEKCRMEAITQLRSLIVSLKRYSLQLENFLDNEGDIIMEHYHAKSLLRGILPEMNESSNKTHPFYEAHMIREVLVNHVRGQTVLSKLPSRKPHFWKGSDLLLLQKTILESVIHQREFFLYCRYTDMLTQMGFDSDDLEKLNRCQTKEMELGTLKIILNEHDFYSKLKGSLKKPIKNLVVKENYNGLGVPRVCMYPAPEQLVHDKWAALIDIRRQTVLSTIEDKDINWMYVLKGLAEKNPKLNNVDEATCKLTYEHLLSFRYNKAPWLIRELKQLQDLRKKHPNASWSTIAGLMGTNRSPFSCFVKFKLHCMNSEKASQPLPKETLAIIKDCFEQCSGNASQVDYMLSRVLKRQNYRFSPAKLLDISARLLNPRLRKGTFTTVEDALLLVIMEKYRDYFLENNGGLDPVGYAFPWRYRSTIRMRLTTLLTRFYSTKWTLEEDRLLLTLRETYGPKFNMIERAFPSKDRRQCTNRYLNLKRILKTSSLEDYHRFYVHKRSGLNLSKMFSVANYLDMTIRSKLAGNGKHIREIDLEFLKLRRRPTDHNLNCYLMTFSVSLMSTALSRLTDLLNHIGKLYKEMPKVDKGSDMATKLQGFDRRKFDLQCPISVGSALHFRNATLVPQDTLSDLTKFEAEVYEAYKFFSARNLAKVTAKRTTIPILDDLRKIRSISRLIMPPPPQASKPGQPSLIVTIKTEQPDELEKEREEQEMLQELEERKKGGRRKGTKRRKTQYKESRKRAAMLRWQNQKAAEAHKDQIESNDGVPSVESCSVVASPMWEVLSPGTPATPGSMVSTATTTDSESVAGLAPSMRKTMLGMLTDHAYILPMESPDELSTLSLPQLFAKMGGVKISKPESN